MPMQKMFNILYGSSAERLAYGTLRLGELWFDEDDGTIYAGDGVTAGGVIQAGGTGLDAEQVRDTIGDALTDTATIDFTYTDSANTIEADVKDGSISNAKLANVATATIKGRVTAATGAVEDLSAANVRTIINVADGATAAGAAGDAFATSHDGAGGTAHAAASTSVAGFLSAADKTKLDGIEASSTAAGAAGDAYATSHESDSTAHPASSIVFTPAGTIAATTVQAAIEEVASEAGSPNTLGGLTDVTITSAQDGDFLQYDTDTSEWINAAVAPGSYTDGDAQDAVGAILTDTNSIDFTYVTSPANTITADVKTAGITSAMLRDSAAVSVIGRSANSTGVPADIAAGANGEFLGRHSDTVGFSAIALADLPTQAQDTFLGRKTASTGVPEVVTAADARTILEAQPPNIDTPSFTAGDLVATRAMLGRQQKLSPSENSTFTLNTVSPSWAAGEMIPLYNDSATYTVTITSGSVTATKASGVDTLVLNPKGYAWIEFRAADAALCDGNLGTVVTFTAAGKALVEAADAVAERAIVEAAAATTTSAVGTSRDVAKATDQGKTVVCSAAVTLTVTTSTAFDNWAECEIYAGGGIVTMAEGASITIQTVGSDPLTIPQYGSARLRKTGTSNEYVLHGTLA